MACPRRITFGVVLFLLLTHCTAKPGDCTDKWGQHCTDVITAGFRKCDEANYQTKCKKTCGLCKNCTDTWADHCLEAITSGIRKCDEENYKTHCKKTCGLCDDCTNILLDCSPYKVVCHEDWVRKGCKRTCLCNDHRDSQKSARKETSTYTTAEQNDSATKSPLVWIGVLTGMVFIAFVAGLTVFVVIRGRIFEPGGPTSSNAIRDAGTISPGTHMTSEACTSGHGFYVNNFERNTSPTNSGHSPPSTHQATKNPECDLYTTVDKSRKQCSAENAGHIFKPDPTAKPENFCSASHKTESYGGSCWSSNASTVQESAGENTYQNAAEASSIMLPARIKQDLVYTELDFSEYRPDRQRPFSGKQETNYPAIDFSKPPEL